MWSGGDIDSDAYSDDSNPNSVFAGSSDDADGRDSDDADSRDSDDADSRDDLEAAAAEASTTSQSSAGLYAGKRFSSSELNALAREIVPDDLPVSEMVPCGLAPAAFYPVRAGGLGAAHDQYAAFARRFMALSFAYDGPAEGHPNAVLAEFIASEAGSWLQFEILVRAKLAALERAEPGSEQHRYAVDQANTIACLSGAA